MDTINSKTPSYLYRKLDLNYTTARLVVQISRLYLSIEPKILFLMKLNSKYTYKSKEFREISGAYIGERIICFLS